ncbi:MAG: septum formation protein Maf [Ignavibacteriae bacterium]|nr:septum formation protein Maf [Ignavibacteriota bacterium]
MLIKKPLILASASQRRQQLFRQIGLEFQIRESGVDETFDTTKSVSENVERLAIEKARFVGNGTANAFIVGADTVVVLGEEILGKPKDFQEAVSMLSKLSGQTHLVYTGFCLFDKPSNNYTSSHEITKVTFRKLGQEEIEEYVKAGSPMDKAGAYGIQDDYGAVFVERIEGCYYNVVGFPLAKFYLVMQDFQKQLGLL